MSLEDKLYSLGSLGWNYKRKDYKGYKRELP
jgi:hypothetical protein